jgi:beta-barrel assembly-enhancing protease
MMPKVISIGRDQENDIVLNDNTVSRQHAQLIIQDKEKFELIDLNSTNGISVNGQKIIGRISVIRNDNVQFGAVYLDWDLIDSHVEKSSNFFKRQPETKKLNVIFPFVIAASILILLFWFLTKDNLENINTVEKTETNATKEKQDVKSDSILKPQSEVVPLQEVSAPNELVEVIESNKNQTTYKPKSNNRIYSISCLRTKSPSNAMIGFGADIEDGWITFSSDEVGVSEEIKVGKELKKEVQKEYTYSIAPSYKKRIDIIFNRLIAVLENPRMKYTYYIINSTEINAFTAGGFIFITTGIIDFAISDDELACVLGHEIYHNELGHINKMIRKEKAAQNWFGDFADWTLIASNIAGASFNQENEAYCDMYGVDLAMKAGYDGSAASKFWSRMESGLNDVEKFFSTHPFSEERMHCIDSHLERNYFLD